MSRDRPDFGPAVVDGFLRRTSASAISTFDPNTYGGCNRRFYFTHVLGIKEPSTKSQGIGHEGHRQLEHWAKTGDDSLGPLARPGKHLLPKYDEKRPLEVEEAFAPDAGTKAAIAMRELLMKKSPTPGWDVAFDREIEKKAGVCMAGVPLVGYVDLRHRRGEYVDAEGALRPEAAPDRTIEVIDHKFTSVDIREKTAAHVDSVQMTIYDVHAGNKYPDAVFVRNSHIYYQIRGAKSARKVTFLTTVDEARRKAERIVVTVRSMVDVARASRIEDVEPYSPSCDAYRGCQHKSVCPHVPNTSIHDLLKVEDKGERMGSFFDDEVVAPSNGAASTGFFAPSVAPVAAPSLPEVSYEEAKARILAEDGVVEKSYGACPACSVALTHLNTSVLQGGSVKHIGCVHIGAINPPDRPLPDPLAAANALSPEAIAEITDPALKAKAEAHRAAHLVKAAAESAAKEAAGEKKAGGKCPRGGDRVQLTQEQAGKKRYVCSTCNKELKIKPSADFKEATLPGHLLPKSEEAPPELPSDEPPPLPAYVAPDAIAGQAALPPSITEPPPLPSAPVLDVLATLSEAQKDAVLDVVRRALGR